MKLRIKGNSVRLRLMQSEVATFQKTGKVSEMIDFGTNTLVYQIQKTENDTIKATFENQTITVFIPNEIGQSWANSNQIGIEATLSLEGKVLKILVEKDFKCLTDRPSEDESDAYPHPKEGSVEC
jgi:archaellum component FlaG (FlaF/FlaG flagellin family)